jgi:RsiW-degrading membrane proteinase PrsW (M82 family)
MTLDTLDLGTYALLAIVAGGVANFALGALWYTVLFGERWVRSTGRTKEEFEDRSPGATMLLTLLGGIVSTGVLAVVYQWGGGQTIMDGVLVGAILGGGVAAMEGLKYAIYNVDERVKPWALYAVNGSYAICGMIVAGVVYAGIA